MERLHRKCLLCASSDLRALPAKYAHAYLVRCGACRLVFCRRVPTPDELIDHYARYPRNQPISPITVKRYETLLDRIEPYRKLNRILDVGCGDGHFLEAARRKGWDVFGTEFTDEAIAVCRARSIPMHKGPIQEYRAEVRFDAVTSFEVLEHLNDGADHVAKIAVLIRPGGILYFTTPNFNSMSRRLLGGKWVVIEYPEHLVYYTASTVDRLLSQAGFAKRSMRSTGLSPQGFRRSGRAVPRPGNADEALRSGIEGRADLRLARDVVNGALSVLRAGDTLKGFYVSEQRLVSPSAVSATPIGHLYREVP
jgi:2-polyprenyl-3-methyl-5-hydroxy-6-metoxy-1,4-benzoquinol methylase